MEDLGEKGGGGELLGWWVLVKGEGKGKEREEKKRKEKRGKAYRTTLFLRSLIQILIFSQQHSIFQDGDVFLPPDAWDGGLVDVDFVFFPVF